MTDVPRTNFIRQKIHCQTPYLEVDLNDSGDWFYIEKSAISISGVEGQIQVQRDGEGYFTYPAGVVVNGSFAYLHFLPQGSGDFYIVYGTGEPPLLFLQNDGTSALSGFPDQVINPNNAYNVNLSAVTGFTEVEVWLNVITAGADVRISNIVGKGAQIPPNTLIKIPMNNIAGDTGLTLFNNGAAAATLTYSFRALNG